MDFIRFLDVVADPIDEFKAFAMTKTWALLLIIVIIITIFLIVKFKKKK